MAKFGQILTPAEMYDTLRNDGGHISTAATYVSGTGTAGTANTAMTVITRTIPANLMRAVGDRLRVRIYFFANTASPIIASCKIGPAASEITVSDISHSGGTASGLLESWIHYIDNTHANIIEQEVGSLGALTAINVAGFTWNASQNLIVTQDAVAGNYITVYGVFLDLLPKGLI